MSGKCTNRSGNLYSSSLDGDVSRFGCWNVKTMSGREEELVDEMKRYGLEVLDISELTLKRIGDATCVYSGVQEGRSTAGVAILLSETFGVFLREWKCIDERNTWIQLQIDGIWVMVVQVYALADDSSPGIKDGFFQKLQETVGDMERVDLMVMMGDMNARVGCDTSIWGEVLGRNGEEVCNDNGKRFCSSAVSTISGSLTHGFHKYT